MQLPRGTFREIRRGVVVDTLLRELDGEKFTGVASISSQSMTGTLVFKAGKCILIKIQNNRGDAALSDLQNAGSEEVDAALSVLGDAQIELALEFNKPCRILKPVKTGPAPVPARPIPQTPREQQRPAMGQKPAVPVAPLKPLAKPAPSPHHVPAPQTAPHVPSHVPAPHPAPFAKVAAPVPPSPPVSVSRQDEEKEPVGEQEVTRERDSSSFESDLDTFDTMDIDNVTDKIRTDCKTMIKQLHLDHLMER